MDLSIVVAALASAIVTSLVALVLWRNASTKAQQIQLAQVNAVQQLEKQILLQEREFLAERNRTENTHAEALRSAKTAAFEEGRQLGATERNAAHINEVTELRSTLVKKFEADREAAVAEAREKLRAEYEHQTKLFSVKISPYVSVKEDKRLIGHQYETATGYQYQLLVNGIPAFAPHVVAEQTEVKKAINPEVEKLLLQSAQRAADEAIKLYLGGSTQFAKLADPIFRRLPKF
jgi:hypothetical protein